MTKEIYIGNEERLNRILENPGADFEITSLGYGATASVIAMDRMVGVKGIVDEIIGHRGSSMSPRDYVLLFGMNRLSDPRSKNGIAEWMATDFASTIYSQISSQGYWNVRDRFTEPQIREINFSILKPSHRFCTARNLGEGA